jgi:hypothetical protein
LIRGQGHQQKRQEETGELKQEEEVRPPGNWGTAGEEELMANEPEGLGDGEEEEGRTEQPDA